MKTILIVLFCLTTQYFSIAQNPGFIKGDENFKLPLAFHKTDTVLVISPNSYPMTDNAKNDIENYVFWDKWQKKPCYSYKTESEVTANDLQKHLQFYGPFDQFQNPDFLNIPIKQVLNGFAFNDQIFDQKGDAFFYISDSATSFYTCKNSGKCFNQYRIYGAGLYQLNIFRDDDFVLTGFSSDKEKKDSINYLDKLRASYFENFSTRYFDFKIAKSLNRDSIERIITTEMDTYVDSLCSSLESDNAKIERITTYIYANRMDLQTFIAAPPGMTVYGKSVGNINHLSSFDKATFRHETSHTFIGWTVGLNPHDFFMEGFAVFNEYFFNPEAFKKDLEIVKDNPKLLTMDLIYKQNYFFDNSLNYPIAGAFTKFIVDRIGISAFKKAYASNQIEEYLVKKTGKNMEQTIIAFQNYSIKHFEK